jgi:hypothetical protein
MQARRHLGASVYICLFGDILVGDITLYISSGANRLSLRLCIFLTAESSSGATDHGPFSYSFEATFGLAVLAEQYRVPSIDYRITCLHQYGLQACSSSFMRFITHPSRPCQ